MGSPLFVEYVIHVIVVVLKPLDKEWEANLLCQFQVIPSHSINLSPLSVVSLELLPDFSMPCLSLKMSPYGFISDKKESFQYSCSMNMLNNIKVISENCSTTLFWFSEWWAVTYISRPVNWKLGRSYFLTAFQKPHGVKHHHHPHRNVVKETITPGPDFDHFTYLVY